MWDAHQFCSDYGVETFPESTQGGPFWLNIQCPACDDKSDHGKFNLNDGGYHCWKCGKQNSNYIIHILTGVPYKRCKDIFDKYESNFVNSSTQSKKIIDRPLSLSLPGGALEAQHKVYLFSRGIDPTYTESVWSVLGTGFVGDLRNRIIFPFFVNGVPVTYQSRSMREKSYRMLSPKYSVIPAKELLYGEWLIKSKERICVCEGPFDAINMGVGFVATCGTGHTPHQVKLLKMYEKVYILFDPEEEAQLRALKLAKDLAIINVDVEVLKFNGKEDPGEFKKEIVYGIRKELGFE